jgi:ELWxxDGT repeat protein
MEAPRLDRYGGLQPAVRWAGTWGTEKMREAGKSGSRRATLLLALAAAAAALLVGSAAAAPGDITVALVKEINPTGTAGIQSITDVNGIAYFRAGDGATPGSTPPEHGEELWRSDGTAAGTFMVKDINTADAQSSAPSELTNVNGILFFRASDGTNGFELWKSDGTPSGTVMVRDINDPGDSDPSGLVNAGGTLFFAANDGSDTGEHGFELWRSVPPYDSASTTMVEDIRTGAASSLSTNPGRTAVGGTVYFEANDGTSGTEPWKSDGTPGNTDILKNIADAGEDSDPGEFTPVGPLVYFRAGTSSEPEGEDNVELWKTDGTELNTEMVEDINTTVPGASSNPEDLAVFNGKLLFAADDGPEASGSTRNTEPWISDGTPGGTAQIANLNPGTESSTPEEFTELSGSAYFSADDGAAAHGSELFRTDGTGPGTTIVADIRPGPTSSGPVALTLAGNIIFFRANDGTTGQELWWTNGGPLGPTGTARAADINPGPGSSIATPLASVGGTLFFSAADDGIVNFELWKATIEGPASPPVPVAGPTAPAVNPRCAALRKKLKKAKTKAKKKKIRGKLRKLGC